MKALKITGIVLVVLAAVVGVLGAIAPSEMHIERSLAIDAPKDFVWEHVNTLEDMVAWSPWAKLDPEQSIEYQGEDGTVGALYHWNGNDQVGEGEQSIAAIDEGTSVATHLKFMRPMESEADATIVLNEIDGQTTATWAFDAKSSFPFNIMNLFMDMDAMLGADFETGLNNLKTTVESAKASRTEFDGISIQTVDMGERTYYGTRSTTAWADMKSAFETTFGNIMKAAGKAKAEPVGAPVGIFYKWDEEGQSADMMPAMPFAAGTTLDGATAETLSGKAIMVEHWGAYENTMNAHMAMEKYLAWHGLTFKGPAVEEYITDPMTEPDTAKWLTKIYYPIQ